MDYMIVLKKSVLRINSVKNLEVTSWGDISSQGSWDNKAGVSKNQQRY